MSPRNPELPEGTDHIINGAMETNVGTGASTGSSGGSSSGFIGSGEGVGNGDGTGGMTAAGGGSGGRSTGGGSGGGGMGGGSDGGGSGGGRGSGNAPVKQQLRDGASSLRDQATTKVREYAEDGKSRATTALDDFSRVVSEAADSIDERLGQQYGQYARQAADAVSGFADTLRQKDVDQLFGDAREVVRKSPAIAIGTAAAVGFALVRLIKSGMPDQADQVDVEFTPDSNLGGQSGASTGGSSTGGATGA